MKPPPNNATRPAALEGDLPVPARLDCERIQATTPSGRRRLQGKLGGLSLPRQVAVLAVWPLLEQFMAFLVGTVDLMLAGRLDPAELQVAATDALGTTSYVTWLMSMIYSSIGVGATALVARAVGGRHKRMVHATLGQSLLLAAVIGLVVGAGVFAAAPWIGWAANLSGDGIALNNLYLRTVAYAAPMSALLLVGSACLRGAGDTRTPFLVMAVVNTVNIVASILFVFGPAPWGGHGVGGIAAGTVIAWAAGLTLILFALLRDWGAIRLHPHRLWPHWTTLRRLIRVGMPAMFERVGGMWVANFLVLMVVGGIGSEGLIGAHMIAIRIESLSFLSGFALSTAAATLTGQYLGLGQPDQARRAATLCWKYGAIFMGLLGVAFTVAPDAFARIITSNPVVVEHSLTPIRICGPIQVFFATQMILGGALRGAGDTRAAMWITTLSMFLLRLPGVYIAGVWLGLGLNGIWVVLCSELVLRGVFFGTRFLRGKWMDIDV